MKRIDKNTVAAIIVFLIGLFTVVILVGFVFMAVAVGIWAFRPSQKVNGKNSDKVPAVLASVLGIFSLVGFLLLPTMGWWVAEYHLEYWSEIYTQVSPISAWGYPGYMGSMSMYIPMLVVLGSIMLLIGAGVRKRAVVGSGAGLSLIGVMIFYISLPNLDGYNDLIDLLNFLSASNDYNIYFGSVDLGPLGQFSWYLGMGFFMCVASVILGAIGTIILKPFPESSEEMVYSSSISNPAHTSVPEISPTFSPRPRPQVSSTPSFLSQEEDHSDWVYCRHCGSHIKPDSLYCRACGEIQ